MKTQEMISKIESRLQSALGLCGHLRRDWEAKGKDTVELQKLQKQITAASRLTWPIIVKGGRR